MRIKSSKVTPSLRTRASEVKVVGKELLERCIEGSGIFLIWADRPIMMNSVLKGLRQRRLAVERDSNPRLSGRYSIGVVSTNALPCPTMPGNEELGRRKRE